MRAVSGHERETVSRVKGAPMNENAHVVRLSSPEDIAASVPSLMGFRPADGDLVVICLRGKRVGVTMRITLPSDTGAWEGVAAALSAAYRNDGATSALVVLYGADELQQLLVTTLLDAQRVDVRESLRVDGDLVTCAAGCTHRLPTAPTVVETANVALGQVVADSREALAARLAYTGVPRGTGDDQQVVASWRWDLRDRDSRDAALAKVAASSDDRQRTTLDQLCTLARHTPPGGDRDTALTAVAAVAYLTGDGGFANVALEGVHGNYRLANLLRQALTIAVPPAEIRASLLAAA